MSTEAKAATPSGDLLADLMNPNIPKSEREHAAAPEIERLRKALAQQQEPTDQQIDAAVKAWFGNTIVAGRRPFAKRMRAAIEAVHAIKDTP